PEGGPGRAPLFSEGDFMLGEFSLAVLPPSGGQLPRTVRLAGATHDYAAEKNPASDAIDDDLDTGWSIKGAAGAAHQAVFVLAEPLELAAGARLKFTLDHRYIHQMTIGRFRLS